MKIIACKPDDSGTHLPATSLLFPAAVYAPLLLPLLPLENEVENKDDEEEDRYPDPCWKRRESWEAAAEPNPSAAASSAD